MILVTFVLMWTAPVYATIEKTEDGKIIMAQEDLKKLYQDIQELEKKCEIYKALTDKLNAKISLLEEENKLLKEGYQKLEEIHNSQTQTFNEQLELLNKKIEEQNEIISNKEIIITLKNERLKSKSKENLFYGIIGILTGFLVDKIITK